MMYKNEYEANKRKMAFRKEKEREKGEEERKGDERIHNFFNFFFSPRPES